MQVRRDARVARGSFSGAARHVNAILLSSETGDPRWISGQVRATEATEPSVALRCGPCETSVPIFAPKKACVLVYRHTS